MQKVSTFVANTANRVCTFISVSACTCAARKYRQFPLVPPGGGMGVVQSSQNQLSHQGQSRQSQLAHPAAAATVPQAVRSHAALPLHGRRTAYAPSSPPLSHDVKQQRL